MDIMAVYMAIKPFLPFAAALVLSVLKKFSPTWIGEMPAEYKVLASALIGAAISFLTDFSSGITLTGALMGMLGGLASSKARDIVVRKPEVAATPAFQDIGVDG